MGKEFKLKVPFILINYHSVTFIFRSLLNTNVSLLDSAYNKHNMGSTLHIILLTLSLTNVALSELFQSEEIIPVRTSVRTGRLWRRSEDQQSLKLTAFGQDFTLNLTTDDTFVAPKLSIQRIKAKHLVAILNGSSSGHFSSDETAGDGAEFTGCFYSGKVDSDQDSMVTVSLCHGIQGTFITHGDEYFIQPKFSGLIKAERSISQVHVIKRRVFTDTHNTEKTAFDQMKDDSRLMDTDDGNFSHVQDAEKKKRKRRFVSTPRYIETLVVADSTMTQFYGDEIKVRPNGYYWIN